MRRTVTTRLVEAVKALALCHNVTPVSEDQAEMSSPGGSNDSASSESSDVELYSLDRSGRAQRNGIITYQASSPRRGNQVIIFGIFNHSYRLN